MISFPTNPAPNEIFPPLDAPDIAGRRWKFTGSLWELYAQASSGGVTSPQFAGADVPTTFSTTPPANPFIGQRWTHIFDLTTYEWFGSAWVEKPVNH